MNEIKSLADQLREQLRTGENPKPASPKQKDSQGTGTKRTKKAPEPSVDPQKAEAFFRAIEEFRIETSEKSMIRVDLRTMNLLKHMKLANGVDMNRFIVYALHQYLGQHPWLPKHIQEILKNSEL
jgi:predicted HicB family RNase H-like nuclease